MEAGSGRKAPLAKAPRSFSPCHARPPLRPRLTHQRSEHGSQVASVHRMDLVRHVSGDSAATSERPAPVPEWLVTNGLGGYASGTTSGVVTRRYHGLLIAALPAPLGRWLVFSHLSDRVRLPSGDVWDLSHPRRRDTATFDVQFRLELGLPVWRYEGG